MVNSLLLVHDGSMRTVVLQPDMDVDNFKDTASFSKKGHGKLSRLQDWIHFDDTVVMYGWTDGEAGNENKHELPPPIDTDLYFGDILAFRVNGNGHLDDFTEELYHNFVEHMLGGFSDLESDDDDIDMDQRETEIVPGDLDDSGDEDYVPGKGSLEESSSEGDSDGESEELYIAGDELDEDIPEDTDWKVWGNRKEVREGASDDDVSETVSITVSDSVSDTVTDFERECTL